MKHARDGDDQMASLGKELWMKIMVENWFNGIKLFLPGICLKKIWVIWGGRKGREVVNKSRSAMKTVDNGVHYIVGFIFCMCGVFHNEKYTTSTLKKKTKKLMQRIMGTR